jgi:hypothetical protein
LVITRSAGLTGIQRTLREEGEISENRLEYLHMLSTPNQGVQFQETLDKWPLKRSDKESTISLIGELPFKDCDSYTR